MEEEAEDSWGYGMGRVCRESRSGTSAQGPVHTLPPGSFPCLQLGFSLALDLGQALNVRRCPHPLTAKQGQPDLCGYQGLWHSFPGDRAGPGVMHREEVYGGGSEKSPARQGGRVERPLAAPQALVPGQGKHSLKLLVSEGWEGGIF